jgi:hypothetical protein
VAGVVNGYYCRNCSEVELARRGMDPARPGREWSGGEVYVPPPINDPRLIRLGVNEPDKTGGTVGTRLNLRA